MKMPEITIDDKKYNSEDLSEKAQKSLVSLQFVNSEIQKLEAQISVFKTAQAAYSQSLKSQLEE